MSSEAATGYALGEDDCPLADIGVGPLAGEVPRLFPLTGDTPLVLAELAVLRVGDALPLFDPALYGRPLVGLELERRKVGVEGLPDVGVEGRFEEVEFLLVGVAGLAVGVGGRIPCGVRGLPPAGVEFCLVGVAGRVVEEEALVFGVEDLVGVAGRTLALEVVAAGRLRDLLLLEGPF